MIENHKKTNCVALVMKKRHLLLDKSVSQVIWQGHIIRKAFMI